MSTNIWFYVFLALIVFQILRLVWAFHRGVTKLTPVFEKAGNKMPRKKITAASLLEIEAPPTVPKVSATPAPKFFSGQQEKTKTKKINSSTGATPKDLIINPAISMRLPEVPSVNYDKLAEVPAFLRKPKVAS